MPEGPYRPNLDADPTRVVIGSYLRTRREALGVSLDEIGAATKIRLGLLEALESEDFPRLPAPIFVKGFLRSYCQYLNLDAVPIVAAFDRQHGGAVDEPEAGLDKFRPRNRAERWSRAWTSFLRMMT